MLQTYENGPEMRGFDDLSPDAPEEAREALAERIAPRVSALFDDYPGLESMHADAPQGERFAQRTVGLALRDLYNPAQLDVMVRVGVIRARQALAADESAPRTESRPT